MVAHPSGERKAIPILHKHNKRIPYDPIVLMELARYDESHGKTDKALKAYAKLAVLPMFDEILHQIWKVEKANNPSPRETAEKLWKSQHGGKTDGFEKYLDDVYAESMPKFTGKRVEPRPADPENRVVLCELFTGAACGPCVAADVAFADLLKTFAPASSSPCNTMSTFLSPIRWPTVTPEHASSFTFRSAGGHRRSSSTACPCSAELCTRRAKSIKRCAERSIVF